MLPRFLSVSELKWEWFILKWNSFLRSEVPGCKQSMTWKKIGVLVSGFYLHCSFFVIINQCEIAWQLRRQRTWSTQRRRPSLLWYSQLNTSKRSTNVILSMLWERDQDILGSACIPQQAGSVSVCSSIGRILQTLSTSTLEPLPILLRRYLANWFWIIADTQEIVAMLAVLLKIWKLPYMIARPGEVNSTFLICQGRWTHLLSLYSWASSQAVTPWLLPTDIPLIETDIISSHVPSESVNKGGQQQMIVEGI